MKTTKHFNSGITLEDIEENSPLENVQKIKEFMRYKYAQPEHYGAIFVNDIRNLIKETANVGKLDEMLNVEFLNEISILKGPTLEDSTIRDYKYVYVVNFLPTLLEQIESIEDIYRFAAIDDSTLVVHPLFEGSYDFSNILAKFDSVLDAMIPDKRLTFSDVLSIFHQDCEELQHRDCEDQQFEDLREKINKNFIHIQNDKDIDEIVAILKDSSEATAVFESYLDLGKLVTNALDFDDLKNAFLKAKKTKNLQHSC